MSGTVSCVSPNNRSMCAPPGERYEDVKRRQSPSPASAAKAAPGAAKTVTKEAVIKGAALAVEHLAPALGPGAIATSSYLMTRSIYDATVKKWNQEGRERNEALVRDNRDMAILMIAATSEPGIVPSEYLNARKCAVVGPRKDPTTHVSGRLATRVMVDAQRGDPVAKSLLNAIMTNFRAGKSVAYRKNVRNDESLQKALREDPAFARAYSTDPAFHQAVQAVKYQGDVDPAMFDRNRDSVMKTAIHSDELRNNLLHQERVARA